MCILNSTIHISTVTFTNLYYILYLYRIIILFFYVIQFVHFILYEKRDSQVLQIVGEEVNRMQRRCKLILFRLVVESIEGVKVVIWGFVLICP